MKAQLTLLTGEVVALKKVHHALGRGYFRVEYQGTQKPLGCLAEQVAPGQYAERTMEELRGLPLSHSNESP